MNNFSAFPYKSHSNEWIAFLAQQGYCVIQKALAPALLQALRSEAEELFHQGSFQDAGIGKGNDHTIRKAIRGDNVLWIENNNPTPVQAAYLDAIEQLRLLLNRELYLGAHSFECHYAVYPAGRYYQRHRDNFRNTSNRLLSCILYLNKHWTHDDGGILRIYLSENSYTDVLPEFGTVVLFRSTELEHEVLASKRERYSLTGWLRKAPPL